MVIESFASVVRGILTSSRALLETHTGEGAAMAELAYRAARREAQKLLNTCWDGRYPVRLRPFNDELNAEVYATDLGNDLSGVVSKEEGRPARIVLNSRHVDRRNRFTWAHELGHVVERKSIAQDNDYSFEDARGQKYDLHEFFADEFAGALLMPEEEITRLERQGYSPTQMATHFDVSVDAVNKRINRLAKNPQ